MKFTTFLLSFLYLNQSYGQDMINPFLDYAGHPVSELQVQPSLFNFNNTSIFHNYNGEYEILLDKYPWGNKNFISGPIGSPQINLSLYALTYQIELVSFPFSIDCGFPSGSDENGGCDALTSDRTLNVPSDNIFSQGDRWVYPIGDGTATNLLWNKTVEKEFDRQQNNDLAISNQSDNESLVTTAFGSTAGSEIRHSVLPHSILKHTIYIHCGPLANDPILSSFSFLVDLTRGRLREYPFRSNIATSINDIADHDLLIRPYLLPSSSFLYGTDFLNCLYSRPNINYSNCEPDYEGCKINYTPFDPISNNLCEGLLQGDYLHVVSGDPFCTQYDINSRQQMSRLPLENYTLNFSTCVRNVDGTTLAGYSSYSSQQFMQLYYSNPIVHKYTIDKNITLENINPIEKIIYNPSEVSITSGAFDLHFPTNYTFKTIRATFPYESEVDDAINDPKNGGPFDPTLVDVPVETDLFKDFHNTDPNYPSNDHKFASIYHLESGSKLTIEPCVKIFDAAFDVNLNSEILFEDYLSNLNDDRFKLLYNGGTITKQYTSKLFQNQIENKNILRWRAGTFIKSGSNVDINNPQGEYIIETPGQVIFEASNYINLESGFFAKSGSKFEASITPVTIPACGPHINRMRNPNSSLNVSLHSENGYFTISPNPTINVSYFMFELFKQSNAQILIYDSMGKLVKQVGEKSQLPAGKYTYKLQSEELIPGIYFAKLVLNDSEKSVTFIKE